MLSSSLVAGLQSHYDRCQFLSVDVPEAAREEIIGLTIDNDSQNVSEVGGASPSFPPPGLMDVAPSQSPMRKTKIAAPSQSPMRNTNMADEDEDDEDHVQWGKKRGKGVRINRLLINS